MKNLAKKVLKKVIKMVPEDIIAVENHTLVTAIFLLPFQIPAIKSLS